MPPYHTGGVIATRNGQPRNLNHTLSQVTYLLNHRTSSQISCPPSQVESTKYANLSFHGFRNTGNRRWWTALLDDFVHNFNFTDILIRRIDAIAPPLTGQPAKLGLSVQGLLQICFSRQKFRVIMADVSQTHFMIN